MKNIKGWEKFNETFIVTGIKGVEIKEAEKRFYSELVSKIQKNKDSDDFIIPYYKKLVEYCKNNHFSRSDTIDVSTELIYGRKRSKFFDLVIFIEELAREYLITKGEEFTEDKVVMENNN